MNIFAPTLKHNKMLDLVNIEVSNFQRPRLDLEKIRETQMKIQESIDSVNEYLAAKTTSEPVPSVTSLIQDKIKNHRHVTPESNPAYKI